MIALAMAGDGNSNPQSSKALVDLTKHLVTVTGNGLPVIFKFSALLLVLAIILALFLPLTAGNLITAEFYMNVIGILFTFILGFTCFIIIIGLIRIFYDNRT